MECHLHILLQFVDLHIELGFLLFLIQYLLFKDSLPPVTLCLLLSHRLLMLPPSLSEFIVEALLHLFVLLLLT